MSDLPQLHQINNVAFREYPCDSFWIQKQRKGFGKYLVVLDFDEHPDQEFPDRIVWKDLKREHAYAVLVALCQIYQAKSWKSKL